MSHTATVKTMLKDELAIRAACKQLGLPEPVIGEVKLHSTTEKGLLIKLPNWKFAIAVNLETGVAMYDNYEGVWGKIAELDKFTQAYSQQVAMMQLGADGYAVDESTLNLVNEAGEEEQWIQLTAESYT